MIELNFTPFPKLVTERLLLRSLQTTDANEIFALRSDDNVNKYLGRPKAKTIEDAGQFIEKILNSIANDQCLWWAIEIKPETVLAGAILLWNIDKEKNEIIITGRTKHFLSLVGEHLSVDNMNKAIEMAGEELNIFIPEFTVAGVPHGTFFAHKWYIASNDNCNTEVLKNKIDQHLRKLNDDYATERDSALKEVFLEQLPEEKFMKFMELKGKLGSQHKFPRVMKGKMLEDWNRFLENGKS